MTNVPEINEQIIQIRKSRRSAAKRTAAAMDTKSEAHSLRISLQCAKAALLLASLKNRNRTTSAAQDYEVLEMEKIVKSLKVDLARERMRLREVRVCGVLEMLIQVMVLISVWSFVLVVAFN